MLVRLFNAQPMEDLRQAARGAFSRCAFVFETAAVAVFVLLLVSFAIFRFEPLATADFWGNLATHWAEAPSAARTAFTRPVAVFVLIVAIVVACVRYPKAKRAFEPFRRPASDRAVIHALQPEPAL